LILQERFKTQSFLACEDQLPSGAVMTVVAPQRLCQEIIRKRRRANKMNAISSLEVYFGSLFLAQEPFFSNAQADAIEIADDV
jgi:hypothetical protein